MGGKAEVKIMKQTINIGTTIDLPDLIKSRMLIQANSGGGKSTIARVIMEQAFGKIPFIVMDIEGEYYTLKELSGDIVVIGGQHADVAISIALASKLPRFIIENSLSVVVDVSDLEMHERIRFAKIFLESLMQLPQQFWVPYLIFLEECHKLAGEQDKYESGPAVKDLMSRGRKRGYCGIPITQRISKLHKDVAAECNNKFIGRTYLDIDMDRAAKELGFSKSDDRLKLRGLRPGNFYAFGTSISPHEVHEVKINKPATALPEAGNTATVKVKMPTSNVVQLLAKLNEDLQKKEVKKLAVSKSLGEELVNEKLEAEVQELKRQVLEKDQQIAELSSLASSVAGSFNSVIDSANKWLENYSKHAELIRQNTGIHRRPVPEIRKNVPRGQFAQKVDKPSSEKNNGKLSKCARSILEFLVTYKKPFTKAQIGVATGYSPNSGGFNNSLAELNTAGYIIRDDGRVAPNDSVDYGDILGLPLPNLDYDAHAFIDKLSKCEREIYEVLLNNPEESFSKDDLANLTETKYSSNSGGFNNSLSRLNTLELIHRESGRIKLNPELLELI